MPESLEAGSKPNLQELLFSEEPIPEKSNYLKDGPCQAVGFSFSSWQQSVVGLLFPSFFFLNTICGYALFWI